MKCKCGTEMDIISGDSVWTVFQCPSCDEKMEEPDLYPEVCVKCEIPIGGPIGCSDCGHFPKRQAQLRANEDFWEKHREDLREQGIKPEPMEFVENAWEEDECDHYL